MTGIMPIKKYFVSSDLNNFTEYTMLKSRELAPYFGFTTAEVKTLCNEYNISFEEMKYWYDGYKLNGIEIYNPLSVVSAIKDKSFDDYWSATSSVEAVKQYLETSGYSLKQELVQMIAGEQEICNVSTLNADLLNIDDKDKALTALIHLGYLSFTPIDSDSGYCYIPNYEIRLELARALKDMKYEYLYKFTKLTRDIVEASFKKDTNTINTILDENHLEFANQYDKNLESSLKYVTIFSFLKLKDTHYEYQEINCIKGRADIVYVPKNEGMPAVIVELKSNKSADSALKQIKDKHYPNCIKNYHGEVLLVGINYDEDYKHENIKEKSKI